MERKKPSDRKSASGKHGVDKDPYDLDLPLWRNYYERVRKSIRFPRYYKKAVNW